jgi:hypothetical protein
MLDKTVIETLTRLARDADIEPASLLAVCDVESGGRIFAKVNGRNEPLIRFEGHYFHRLLGTSKRNQAIVEGLAHRKAGRVKNPRTQKGRWKLMARASAIDRHSALQSTSWGIGQVMGIHWKWLGYASVDAMIDTARSGIEGQAELMLRFIEKSGLSGALERADWRAFARGYNGPAYASNRYDVKLAKAQRCYSDYLGSDMTAQRNRQRHQRVLIRFGDRGDLVADLQKQLRRNGNGLKVDGDFGPATLAALKRFQQAKGLAVDGIAGPATFEVLVRQLR